MSTTYNDVLLHHIDRETDNVLFPQTKSKLITLEEDQEEATLDKRLTNTPRLVEYEEGDIPTNITINASLLGGRSIEDIEALISTRAPKSYTIDTVLEASKWVTNSSDGTSTNILSIDNIDENTLVELTLCNNTTTEQIKAYQKANILGVSQGKGTITLKAINTKPAIDLPICVIIRGDLISSSTGEKDEITVSDEWSLGSCTTTFNEDGSITETNGLKTIETSFIGDNIIESVLTYKGISKKKVTTFNEDGSITEKIVIL